MSTQPGQAEALGVNPELRRNALGLPSVLFQGITHIGPAVASYSRCRSSLCTPAPHLPSRCSSP